jgi:hypothetical protein
LKKKKNFKINSGTETSSDFLLFVFGFYMDVKSKEFIVKERIKTSKEELEKVLFFLL